MPTTGATTNARLRVVPARLVAWGPWVFVLTVGLHLASVLLWPNANWFEIDMQVYRAGGEHVLRGDPLYDSSVFGDLMFTYPPFAAVLFVPLAFLHVNVARVLFFVGDIALLFAVSRMCWRGLTTARGADLVKLSLMTAGLAVWIDPIRITLYLGQINVLLMALVVWDLYHSRSRWAGIGVGLAAGIKLTPLIFIPFLLITRQFRAAATATATFMVTIGISFVFAPSSASAFWFGGTFMHLDRVANPAGPGNQSINGTLLRAMGQSSGETMLWLACAAIIGVVGLTLAVLLHRRGHTLPAIALVGMCGGALSPYSWNHHWVWPLMLLVWLLARGTRNGYLGAGILYFVCLGFQDEYPSPGPQPPYILSGWMYLPVGGWPQAVLHNLWVLIYLGAVLGFGRLLLKERRTEQASEVARETTDETRSVPA